LQAWDKLCKTINSEHAKEPIPFQIYKVSPVFVFAKQAAVWSPIESEG